MIESMIIATVILGAAWWGWAIDSRVRVPALVDALKEIANSETGRVWFEEERGWVFDPPPQRFTEAEFDAALQELEETPES